jgi:hypothetical protein
MLRFVLLAGALVLMATAGHAEPYALRGYKLGITIDEFKAMTHPDSANYPGEKIHILCTGDQGATPALTVTESNGKLGLIYCKYFLKKTTSLGQSYEDAKIMLQTIGLSPKFTFVPAPDNGPKRLGYIFVDSDMRSWDKLYAAYQAAYGQASEVTKEKLNIGTTVVDKITAIWQNPDSLIFLGQRTDDQLDLVTIDYTHKALSDFTRQRRKALTGKSN